jgi:hypothetical protein
MTGEETYLLAWYDGALVGHGVVPWQGCTDTEVRAAFPSVRRSPGWASGPNSKGDASALHPSGQPKTRPADVASN